MFNKKKYKENLPDGDCRKNFVNYPIKAMLAEIYSYVQHEFEDTCYLRASQEMKNSGTAEIKDLKRENGILKSKLEIANGQIRKLIDSNNFLIASLQDKYSDGLFIASNLNISGRNLPIVCIQNGENITKNAKAVSVNWQENDCYPEINVEYNNRDCKEES